MMTDVVSQALELNPDFKQQCRGAQEAGGYVILAPDVALVMMPLPDIPGDWICLYAGGDFARVCFFVDAIPGCERVWWKRGLRSDKSQYRCHDRATFTRRARRMLNLT